MHKDVLRLAGLLAALALATSRFGLVGHELVGHGGAALAFGAEIEQVQLFWFAGGWIRYQLSEPSLAAALTISMAGIGLELIAGGLLWSVVRGRSLGRRLVRGIGAALVLHATWYLAIGAWQGFGDGLIFHRELGGARVPVAIASGLVTCAAACFGARETMSALAGTLRGSRRARVLGVIIALALAGGLNAGLVIGELAIRRDPTYAATMKPERERRIAAEMRQWSREQATRGVAISASERRAEQERLERLHKTFPFAWLLAICAVVAGLAGVRFAKPAADERIENRLLVLTICTAVAAIALVIVIDVLPM